MKARKPELDVEDARRRLAAAAEEAKRLEDAGEGWSANDAWKRYLLIKGALEAQERKDLLKEHQPDPDSADVVRELRGALPDDPPTWTD